MNDTSILENDFSKELATNRKDLTLVAKGRWPGPLDTLETVLMQFHDQNIKCEFGLNSWLFRIVGMRLPGHNEYMWPVVTAWRTEQEKTAYPNRPYGKIFATRLADEMLRVELWQDDKSSDASAAGDYMWRLFKFLMDDGLQGDGLICVLTGDDMDRIIRALASNWHLIEKDFHFERNPIGTFVEYSFFLGSKMIQRFQISTPSPYTRYEIDFLTIPEKRSEQEIPIWQRFSEMMWSRFVQVDERERENKAMAQVAQNTAVPSPTQDTVVFGLPASFSDVEGKHVQSIEDVKDKKKTAGSGQDELRQKCALVGFSAEETEQIINRENVVEWAFILSGIHFYRKRILQRDLGEQVLLLIDEHERVKYQLSYSPDRCNFTDYIYHRLFSLSGIWPDFEMSYILKRLKRKGWVHTNIENPVSSSGFFGDVTRRTYVYSHNAIAELTAEGEKRVADIVQELQRGASAIGQQDNDTAEASKFAHHKYDTAKLREMIIKAFDDDEFTAFCYDHFRLTYDRFSTGMTRPQKIQLLIEDCGRGEKLDELLRLLKHYRPDIPWQEIVRPDSGSKPSRWSL